MSNSFKRGRKDWGVRVEEAVHNPGVGFFDELFLLEEQVANCCYGLLRNHNRSLFRRRDIRFYHPHTEDTAIINQKVR
jgi:hypothetical protein